jgi:hypothetical protein
MKKTLEEQLAFAYINKHYFLVHNFNGFGFWPLGGGRTTPWGHGGSFGHP